MGISAVGAWAANLRVNIERIHTEINSNYLARGPGNKDCEVRTVSLRIYIVHTWSLLRFGLEEYSQSLPWNNQVRASTRVPMRDHFYISFQATTMSVSAREA